MTLELSRSWKLWLPALYLAFAACSSTQPFRDKDGNAIPGSIAAIEDLQIGGLEQRVLYRGWSIEQPPLILVHGGPGVSETALFRHYTPDLERDFLVVYWDQRGAGRSFSMDISPASMTIEQFVADLAELVTHVQHRFGKAKVVLLAHSWGTIPALLYAERHPENIAAYVGIAQIVNPRRGAEHTYTWAETEARRRGDQHALRELEELGPPPYGHKQGLKLEAIAERLDGVFHAPISKGDLILNALRTSEASLVDLYYFGRGNAFSLEHVWPQMQALDLSQHRRFSAPIIFALGRHDQHTPSDLASAYFETIEAPYKRLRWFEDSAHNPPFEQPREFVEFMRSEVVPLARTQRELSH